MNAAYMCGEINILAPRDSDLIHVHGLSTHTIGMKAAKNKDHDMQESVT